MKPYNERMWDPMEGEVELGTISAMRSPKVKGGQPRMTRRRRIWCTKASESLWTIIRRWTYRGEIMAVPLLPIFKLPPIDLYDRSKDQVGHLETRVPSRVCVSSFLINPQICGERVIRKFAVRLDHLLQGAL